MTDKEALAAIHKATQGTDSEWLDKALAHIEARLSASPSIPEGESEPPAYQERRVWIPEAPKFPGTYAAAHPEQGENCTRVISKSRQFKTREECAAWCAANPRPIFDPHEHIFVTLPPPAPTLRDLRGIAPDCTYGLPSEQFVRLIRNGWTPPGKTTPLYPPAVTDEDKREMLYALHWITIPKIREKLRAFILAPPVVNPTMNVDKSITPKKVSRADIREWVRAMANIVDEHRDILQDRYLMMCEANENYLHDKLREKDVEVEEEK